MFIWILGAAIAESMVSLVGRLFVFWKEEAVKKVVHRFISFAVGALLGVVFLDLLPEAVAIEKPDTVFIAALIGFVLFFLLERFLFWYPCHDGVCPVHAVGYLVLIGDAIHNFIDGVVIAVAFLADFRLGILTSIAVIFHELPQEISDFVVLLHSGFSRSKALLYNFFIALTTVVGAVLAYVFRGPLENTLGIALGVVAGNFLYIAAADLIPELHHQEEQKTSDFVLQIVLIVAGIGVVTLAKQLVH